MWIDLENPTDLALVHDVWADAADLDTATLARIFTAAHETCAAYAPLLVAGSPVPESYKQAEVMQARHIWGQFNGGDRGSMGADGYETTIYPLIFAAQNLMRPKRSPLGRLR